MKLPNINNVKQNSIGNETHFLAWIKRKRHHGNILFLDLVDHSGEIQCICENNIEKFNDIVNLKIESAIEIKGNIVKGNNNLEINILSIENIYPNTHNLTDLRTIDFFNLKYVNVINNYRHLYIRNPQMVAIMKFRAKMMGYLREWFVMRQFIEVDAPILTPVPLYHDSTAMQISIKENDVFLTQCAGFYLESMAHALGRVYNMGPSFRAEESRSKRHLMEYWHIKAEMVTGNLETIIDDVESILSYVVTQAQKDTEIFEAIGTKLCTDALNVPFPRIKYKDAINLLISKGSDVELGTSLSSNDEAILSKHFKNPVWVVGIPEKVEPFPYIINPEESDECMVADLIASNGYGELLGVAEKIYDLTMLEHRMKNKDKNDDPRYEWIKEVHQTGCVPHVAFGMGLERLLRWLLNIPHVRDCIPFPRGHHRKVYP